MGCVSCTRTRVCVGGDCKDHKTPLGWNLVTVVKAWWWHSGVGRRVFAETVKKKKVLQGLRTAETVC